MNKLDEVAAKQVERYRRVYSINHYVAAFIVTGVLVPMLWMVFDREPPYIIDKVEIAPEHPMAGTEINITFHARRQRSGCGPALVYREFKQLTDSRKFVYDPVTRREQVDITGDGKFTRTAKLPIEISGPVVYRGAACSSCNLLQAWLRWPVCAVTPEAPFTVQPVLSTKPNPVNDR